MLTSFNQYDKSYRTYTGKNNSLHRISQFEQHNMFLFLTITEYNQWRIQNFPYGGTPTPGFVTKPIIWKDFCRKLHENEKKLDGVGGRASLVPSLDPPMTLNINFFQGQTQDIESTSTRL